MKAALNPNPGTLVKYEDRVWRITHRLGLSEVLIRPMHEVGVGEPTYLRVSIHALKPYDPEVDGVPKVASDLEGIPEEHWAVAHRRFQAIEPVLKIPSSDRTYADVLEAAKAAQTGKSSIYRWLKQYEETRKLSSLLPSERSDKGKARIEARADEIVNGVIERRFLTPERPRVTEIYDDIKAECQAAGVAPPGLTTVYRRIAQLPDFITLARHQGQAKADATYSPSVGSPPDARWPLQTVEIDHTVLDLNVLDSEERQPIGRPYLTWAEDTFSREIQGFCVTLEPPSALSVALCVAHAVLPKEQWLAERGIEGEWKCFGIMDSIRVDNAREFHGEALEKACDEYQIKIKWRPKGQPAFGGRVESSFRSILQKTHSLPGTTFSNVQERGDYPSEERAVYTLEGIERWIARVLVNEYQVSVHSALNTTPAKRYEEGILGTRQQGGLGLPAIPADPEEFFINFLPFKYKTVQREGISLFGFTYYDPILNRWIRSKEPGREKKAKQFKICYDPRNMRRVYFYDPELKCYFPVYLRDTGHPEFTLWEMREAKRRLRKAGQKDADEKRVIESILKRRQEEEELIRTRRSVRRTKTARRNRDRLRHAAKTWDDRNDTQRGEAQKQEASAGSAPSGSLMEIAAFDDFRTLGEE